MINITIKDEGHTVACLLRDKLLSSSRFAACIVEHPQENSLTIKIDHENPDDVILDAVLQSFNELDHIISNVQKSLNYDNCLTNSGI